LAVSTQNASPAAVSARHLRSDVANREVFEARTKTDAGLRPWDEQPWWRSAQWCALGSLGVAMITLAGFRLGFNFAAASLCYLLLIVLQSLTGDFAACCFVSLVALGSLDYFFTSPILSFRVGHPVNILALCCFLVTALVITRLVSKVRDKAALSWAQHQKTQQLYEVAQHLLAADPREASGSHFLEPFRGAFGVRAACLFDAGSSELHVAGDSEFDLPEKTRDAYIRGKNHDDRRLGIFVRCIQMAGRTTGAVGFEGLEDDALTAGPLTALAAALLERTHAVRNANLAAAAAQTEAYRSVILDALAHEFKTPLSTILAAAGALREAASLGPEHLEMAETVEHEAARLGRLTTRLIRTARLEQEEIRPWMELTHFASVVADAVSQYSRLSGDRKINVLERCHSADVLADPDLLRLAISQLLDNACKYSTPGSAVDLIISKQESRMSLRVLSTGTPISSSERAHIFERFYRGVDARRMTAGTGLGLFVARKIAIAHGGNLELDSAPSGDSSVAFRMTIPLPESEPPESEMPESEMPESEMPESEMPESEMPESEMNELRENL
jgi:two-component system sensor histidine kinase KdpD